MNAPAKLWNCVLRGGSFCRDAFENVAVGDPDPTPDPDTIGRHRICRHEWEDASPTLILPWYCTRERGHQGQHVAGTGESVAAVRSRLQPTVTAPRVLV